MGIFLCAAIVVGGGGGFSVVSGVCLVCIISGCLFVLKTKGGCKPEVEIQTQSTLCYYKNPSLMRYKCNIFKTKFRFFFNSVIRPFCVYVTSLVPGLTDNRGSTVYY